MRAVPAAGLALPLRDRFAPDLARERTAAYADLTPNPRIEGTCPLPSLNPTRWPHRLKLIAAFATLYIVWGTTYLAIRIGLDADLPAAAFLALRLVPAGLILLGYARLRGRPLKVSPRDRATIATVGLFLLVGGQYGTYLAEQTIPSGLAALIVAMLPLWIATAESFLPNMDRPSARGYLGLAIGFAGLGILLVPRFAGISATAIDATGVAFQILATWLWTTGSVISKRRPVKTDAIVATGFQMVVAGAALAAIATVRDEWSGLTFTPSGAAALLYLTLIGSCLAFTAFVWLLRNAPASKVMTYAYVNPVVAVFLGWLVLSEPIDIWVLAGMAVIVTGVALTTSAPVRPPRSVAAPAPALEDAAG
jgi:drug/metabolite transporter (DMT)-like permease